MNNSLILLSGGLDSLVSLAFVKDEYNISFALTFDYGQKARKQEIASSAEISRYYGIKHKVIAVPWLAEITKTSLVSPTEEIPELKISDLDILELTEESAKKVWVPNRNGLFINIAAGFADAYEFTHIIFGANKEEAVTFSDNSQKFINRINKSLEYSTLVKPEVVAPLINYNKIEIVKIGMEKNIPFDLARSCYNNTKKHCGRCESCLRFKRALIEAGYPESLGSIFEECLN